jgi:membrane protein DedA with SNARE-associated domain
MLDPFLDLLKTHGPWLTFLWSTLDTDFIFLILGAFGHAGSINLSTCLPAALLGALLHDTVVFWIVRNRADWVRSRPSYQRIGPKMEAIAKKAGYWQLALCRPLYGTRYPTITFWGLQKLSWSRFLLADALGLFPWAVLLTSLGYVFEHQLEALKQNVILVQRGLLGVVIVVALTLYVLSKRRKSADPKVAASKTEDVP